MKSVTGTNKMKFWTSAICLSAITLSTGAFADGGGGSSEDVGDQLKPVVHRDENLKETLVRVGKYNIQINDPHHWLTTDEKISLTDRLETQSRVIAAWVKRPENQALAAKVGGMKIYIQGSDNESPSYVTEILGTAALFVNVDPQRPLLDVKALDSLAENAVKLEEELTSKRQQLKDSNSKLQGAFSAVSGKVSRDNNLNETLIGVGKFNVQIDDPRGHMSLNEIINSTDRLTAQAKVVAAWVKRPENQALAAKVDGMNINIQGSDSKSECFAADILGTPTLFVHVSPQQALLDAKGLARLANNAVSIKEQLTLQRKKLEDSNSKLRGAFSALPAQKPSIGPAQAVYEEKQVVASGE